jgi:CubicO group peptidase (beta-lactamase class C family)
VPAFGGRRITLRHLLTHTSELRDQWELLGLEERGPGRKVQLLQTIIDLAAHQQALSFPPGSEQLYSNMGYFLLAAIVERVSGQSLAAFTRERMLWPLGATRTRWRDDLTAVVPGRATAYAGRGTGPFRTDMPFTNVIGNGWLLSTVGDWFVRVRLGRVDPVVSVGSRRRSVS